MNAKIAIPLCIGFWVLWWMPTPDNFFAGLVVAIPEVVVAWAVFFLFAFLFEKIWPTKI